jgi:ActR/RegA family two-component response regulator
VRWYEQYRGALGAMAVLFSNAIAFLHGFDYGAVSAGLTAIGGSALGLYAGFEAYRTRQRRVNAEQQREDAKALAEQQRQDAKALAEQQRQDLRKATADRISAERAQKRHQLRMMVEEDRAMEGTLRKQVQDLTTKLAETEERAAKDRAEISAQLRDAKVEVAEARRQIREMQKSVATGNDLLEVVAKRIDHSCRVMIVDDNEDLLSGLCRQFASRGFECETARSLEEAREKFTGRCYWVWVDLSLPDGSGLDFVREIKERNLSVKVGVLTGRGDEDDIAAASAALVDLLRRKPVSVDDLIRDMKSLDDFAPRSLPTRMPSP